VQTLDQIGEKHKGAFARIDLLDGQKAGTCRKKIKLVRYFAQKKN
jgi:hypothetical protein